MAKLKRRDFMKLLGAVAITPMALLRAKPKTHPVDVLIDLGMCDGSVYHWDARTDKDTASMKLDGKGKWHYCVADIPWHKPSEIYIDGKKCTSVAFNDRTEYLSFSILKTSEGFIETFWFRNT